MSATAKAKLSHKAAATRDWAGEEGKVHPTIEELPLVEPYLGVFERLFVAYRVGQVDPEIFDDLYGYRLDNIWANKQIVKLKLQNDALKKKWRGIIALTFVLEAQRGKPFSMHTDTYFPAELLDRCSARKILDQRAMRERTERRKLG